MPTEGVLFLTVPLEQVGQSDGALPERPVLFGQSEVRNVLGRRASDCEREDASERNPNTRLESRGFLCRGNSREYKPSPTRCHRSAHLSARFLRARTRAALWGRDSPEQQSEMRHLVTIVLDGLTPPRLVP